MRMNPESFVIPRDGSRDSFHRRLEVLMARVDVEPLLQYVVRLQLRKLFSDRGLMRMFRTDQNTMPLPPAGLGRFNQHHHLTAEQINGQSTEHPFREKARMVLEGLKDPFVIKRLHQSPPGLQRSDEPLHRQVIDVHAILQFDSVLCAAAVHEPVLRIECNGTLIVRAHGEADLLYLWD